MKTSLKKDIIRKIRGMGLNIRENKSRPQTPFMIDYYIDKKRVRKSFPSVEMAYEYAENYTKTKNKAINHLWKRDLTDEEILDVNASLNMLPYGKTLVEAVSLLVGVEKNISKSTPSEAIQKFLETKIGKIAKSSLKSLQSRLKSFERQFESWEDATPINIQQWLLGRGASQSIYHHFVLLKEFYSFCIRREYISVNSMAKIHTSDLPKIISKDPKFFTVDETKAFFEFIKLRYPEYTRWFAVAFFTGIRRAELNRLEISMFDFARKEILLHKSITKTGDTWLMSGLPSNLWTWLEEDASPWKDLPENEFENITRHLKEDTGIKWHHNTARHSFATYHLSLYRETQKTSLLLRHRNGATLWQHYLGGLASEDMARKYFSIEP